MINGVTCVRAAIYCRISSDREGAGLGVDRQERECRELAARLGWEVIAVYADNDISAYSGKHRPNYNALLEAIQSGEVDGLLVWHTDRLHRSPLELEHFINVIERAGVPVQTVQSGPLDLATPSGRLIARQLGAVARYESEHKAQRIRAKARELAAAGKIGGGGSRPFGYEDDRITVRESEAVLIRQAARAVLTLGTSLHGVCRDWNERSVKTVGGTRWTPHVLRRMLMSARISGRREHRGVIVADAVWPGIISHEESDRLRELLSDPARTTNGGDSARRYLLTGFLYCGLDDCGRKLIARPQGDHQRSYVCADIGMSHLRIHAERVELYVQEAALDYLDEFVSLRAALASRPDASVEDELWKDLANYQRRLEEAERAFWVDEKLSEAAYRRVSTQLEVEITRVKGELARVQQDRTLVDLPATSELARRLWDERTLTWRRTLLGVLIKQVTIGPGIRGLNKFDPNRVRITWRKPA